jgi:ABC-2 type transport system permease protein
MFPTQPLSPEREAKLFWRLRWRLARTQLAQALTTARLRVLLVVTLSLFFWFGLFILFYEGFVFLVNNFGRSGAAVHAETVQLIFHVFFASLNVMLLFSSGIVLYGGLFRAPETRFLLTTPARPERIVLYKFQEALFFSSWGFFLLGSPMMLAYGIVVEAPWTYYVLLGPLITSFVYIPCSLGAIAALVIVYRLPRVRRLIVAVLALAVIIISLRSIWLTVSGPSADLFGERWFQETLERFRFTRGQWLPSTWLTAGLLEAARRPGAMHGDVPWLESAKYLAVLFSNALLLHVILVWTGKRLVRKAYNRVISEPDRTPYGRRSVLDRLAFRVLAALPEQVRLLLVKDFRVFRRDPVQWSQFLIFFGLLALYFFNIDRFRYEHSDLSYSIWVNTISFLNLAVVGLILSTFTTRFIYPMLSLEGNRFWILGLLPVSRDTIVWSKFVFAAVGSWVPCATLVLLSDLMLKVTVLVVLVHQVTCLLLSVGLAAIAVGLGAAMPNLRERSPSKIAAGFGGTLNLVLSASYIILIVLLTALPCHFYLLAEHGSSLLPAGTWLGRLLSKFSLSTWTIVGITGAVMLSIAALLVPMRAGLRAFRAMQF